MKTNKEQVYEFFKLHFSTGKGEGLTTQFLAETLGIGRTNVSSILNSFAASGVIQKVVGRPVRYFLAQKSEDTDEFGCLSNLVGYAGSLQRAVQLAKAAILYPQQSLDTLIVGERGTGKSFLAMLMHRFAVERGVLADGAPFVTFDCGNYAGRESAAAAELLGTADVVGCVDAARAGVLLIDNAHLLDAHARNLLMNRIQQRGQGGESPGGEVMVILSCDAGSKAAIHDFHAKIPILIELPALSMWPLTERKELISRQFTLEATRAKRTLSINAEVLRCLLMYDCPFNISQLKMDIKVGCANAYMREHRKNVCELNLYISDFEHYVRTGFRKYRERRSEVEPVIPANYSYSFSESAATMTLIEHEKLGGANIYDYIALKAGELASRGLSEEDISLALDAEVENTFRAYQNEITGKVQDKGQLSRLVDTRIIGLVEEFLASAALGLQRAFPPSVFYGLCLHVDAAIKRRQTRHSISAPQISDIVEHYSAEYQLSLRFSKTLQDEFSVVLPIDEVIFIAMFLCYKAPRPDNSKGPVLLYIFHGDDVAKTIASAVNALAKNDNVFYFDIPFDRESTEVYSELRDYIKCIDRGKGVIVFYDMELLSPLLDAVAVESDTPIRTIPFPVISMGIDCSRIAAANGDIDEVRADLLAVMRGTPPPLKKVIVTLCSTGEGGAQQLLTYLKRYGQLADMDVIPLADGDGMVLRRELAALIKTRIIHCIVGTRDPKLFAIPFIPIAAVFSVPPEELPSVLSFKNRERDKIDFDEVYDYLGEQLEYVDIKKLRKTLPQAVEELNREVILLSLDTEIGLFVHLACCINRILGRVPIPENLRREAVIAKYKGHYKKIVRILKPVERTFEIVFSDDEIANIITIINKL